MTTKAILRVPAMLAAATLFFAGCGEKLPDPEINIPETEDIAPVFARDGGTSTVAFHSATDWTASVTAVKSGEWISVNPTSGKAGDVRITITVQANEEAEGREATVTIQSGNIRKEVRVTQDPGKFKDEAWYATNYWKRTDREQLGLRGPVKTFKMDVLPYTEYEFDQAGRLISERMYNVNKEFYQLWTYTYDAKGHLVKKVCTSAEDNFTKEWETYEYEYANEGRLVSASFRWSADVDMMSYSNGAENWWYRKEFVWDLSREIRIWPGVEVYSIREMVYGFGKDGNLTITQKDYDIYKDEFAKNGTQGEHANGVTEQHSFPVTYQNGLPYESHPAEGATQRFTWQANGMPATFYSKIPETTYTWMGDQEITCSWYENGRYLAREHFLVPHGYAGSWKPDVKVDNTFNEYGDLLTSDHMNGDEYKEDGHIYHDRYGDYVYDNYGNWISRTEYVIPIYQGEEAASERVARRIITYY